MRLQRGDKSDHRQVTRTYVEISVMKQTLALTAAVAATVLALATACTSTSTTAPKPTQAQLYTACMRTHGIRNFPEPVDGHIELSPSSGIDMSSPQFQSANAACGRYAPHSSPQQPPQAQAAQWPAFAAWLKQQHFSGAALVARDGIPVLDAGYGMADRATRTPNTTATSFCIASIGKLFTAVAIAQLAEQHELSFSDPVGRYLRGLPWHMTIGELLDMTSGLGDVVLTSKNPPQTLAGMMKLISGERPAPGAGFRYSNDGYIVLGAVIQAVSGQSYDGYIRQHILAPAGMTHTSLAVYTPAHVPGMAHGYTLGGRDISDAPQIANPSGGAISTAGDLLRFAQALTSHKLLSPAMFATVLTPRVAAPQPGGPPTDEYTYGFAYQAINGVTFVGHNGGTPGYEGQLDIYPKSGYVVILLANQDGILIPAIQRTEAMLTAPQAQ
jgi:CubicO group peptidase (beta-lactamase class C family)